VKKANSSKISANEALLYKKKFEAGGKTGISQALLGASNREGAHEFGRVTSSLKRKGKTLFRTADRKRENRVTSSIKKGETSSSEGEGRLLSFGPISS